MKRVAVFTINDSFLLPVLEVMHKRFMVRIWKPSGEKQVDIVNLSRLLEWCDIAYFEWCQTPFIDAMCFDNLDCKIVVRLLGLPFYHLARNIPWRRVDLAIAPYPIYKKFEEWKLQQPKRLIEAPVGTDTGFFTMPKNKRYGKNLAMHATVIRPTKRVYTTIETFYELLKLDNEWNLHIAGNWEHGWQKEIRLEYVISCRDLIRRLRLENKVYTYPHMDPQEWWQWLWDKDIIVSNSFRESFHKSVMDAMSCGVYPLVHAWPGAEHYYPEECIFRTQAELVEKILEWAKLSFEEKRTLSQLMRSHARKFDQHEIANKICDMIERLA